MFIFRYAPMYLRPCALLGGLREPPLAAAVGYNWMVKIFFRYRPQERCLDGPGLLEVLRLDQEIILLGCPDITVTGQLLDYVDGELAGPVGNTGAPHIMESVWSGARRSAYGLEAPQQIINQILTIPPAAFSTLR